MDCNCILLNRHGYWGHITTLIPSYTDMELHRHPEKPSDFHIHCFNCQTREIKLIHSPLMKTVNFLR